MNLKELNYHNVILFWSLLGAVVLAISLFVAWRFRDQHLVKFVGRPHPPSGLEWIKNLFGSVIEKKKWIRDQLESKFHPLVQKRIFVHLSPNAPEAPEDGNFHIYFHSSKTHTLSQGARPGRILGATVRQNTSASFYSPSGEGNPIIDSSTNFVVAELIHDALYVHVDLLGSGRTPSIEALDQLFRAVVKELQASKRVSEIAQGNSCTAEVVCDGIDERFRQTVIDLVRATVADGARAVVVRNCAGQVRLPVLDNCLYVNLFSAPAGSKSRTTAPEFFYHPIAQRTTMFAPSPLGLEIKDSRNNVIGELVENNIYLHYDALHARTLSELAALAEFLVCAKTAMKYVADKTRELTQRATQILGAKAGMPISIHLGSTLTQPQESGFHIYFWNDKASGQYTRQDCWKVLTTDGLADMACGSSIGLTIEGRTGTLGEPAAHTIDIYDPLTATPENSGVAVVLNGNCAYVNLDITAQKVRGSRSVDLVDICNLLFSELEAKEFVMETLGELTAEQRSHPLAVSDTFTSGRRLDLIEGLVRRYICGATSKSVQLSNCNGRKSDPKYDDAFHVLLDCAPNHDGSKAWNFSNLTSNLMYSFRHTRLGISITFDGFHCAELVDDNLYISSKSMVRGSYTEARALAKTLATAASVYKDLAQQKQKVHDFVEDRLGSVIGDTPLSVSISTNIIKPEAEAHPDRINIYFWDAGANDRPASGWLTFAPDGGLTSNISAGAIVLDRNGLVCGEIDYRNIFLSVDVTRAQDLESNEVLKDVIDRLKESLVEQHNIEEAISTVQAQDAELDATPYMVQLEGEFDPRSGPVFSQLVCDFLLARIGSNVSLINCQGVRFTPMEDESFRIYVQSSPEGILAQSVPDTVFSNRFSRTRKTTYLPSPHGLPIVDEQTGFVAGELIGRNLYMFENLSGLGTIGNAASIMRFLLEVRKAIITGASSDEAACRQYVRECNRNYSAEEPPTDLQTVHKEFHDLVAQLQKDENDSYLPDAGAEQLEEEFDQLHQLTKVKKVEVSTDQMCVYTRTLYCVNPLTLIKHEIGEFKITLHPNQGTITWKNLTRLVRAGNGEMNAPHIDGNGNACMGNTMTLFPSLISKRQFIDAIDLAITFVESVNITDSWGKYLPNWPAA